MSKPIQRIDTTAEAAKVIENVLTIVNKSPPPNPKPAHSPKSRTRNPSIRGVGILPHGRGDTLSHHLAA